MKRMWSHRMCVAGLVVSAALGGTRRVLCESPAAVAQASDDALMKAYVLTLVKVNGYLTATQTLADARKEDRALVTDITAMKDADSETVAEVRAALKARPRILAFFQKAGLSVDDVVLIPRVLAAAGVAAEFPAASGAATAAQIAFVKQNRAVLDRFQRLNKTLEDDDNEN